jgi:hypothetical protein
MHDRHDVDAGEELAKVVAKRTPTTTQGVSYPG